MSESPNRVKLDALIARLAAAKSSTSQFTGISLDSYQQQFLQVSQSLPKTAVVIGAAGTGKSTIMKQVCESLLDSGKIPPLSEAHKSLQIGAPGIAIVAFTNRAVNAIRKKLPPSLQPCCITIHKLLEYAPEYEEYVDSEGNWKTKRVFLPSRNSQYPLPQSLRLIIFEESSMVGVDLYNLVIAALPSQKPAMIFLGDINQLPPVFGPAILGYKMLEAADSGTLVELKTIHRQAAENPIISLAHKILKGEGFRVPQRIHLGAKNEITIIPLLKCLSPDSFIHIIAKQLLEKEFAKGTYAPMEDFILMPFNKGAGTIELNRYIGTMYARARSVLVHEIATGMQTIYLSEGDRVLYGKLDCVVRSIEKNPAYFGKTPAPASLTLDYWGADSSIGVEHHLGSSDSEGDIDFLDYSAGEEDEDITSRQCSHIVTLELLDDPEVTYEIKTSGDMNTILLAYAITVHKSQGSEARKVWAFFHRSHACMLSRELLYTAVTRAREELVIVCEIDGIEKACAYQAIPGDNVYEKAELFKGKAKAGVFPRW